MQIFYPKFGNIFNFCRILQFLSPSWRIFNHRVGAISFGHLAENYSVFLRSFVPCCCGKTVGVFCAILLRRFEVFITKL
jgi:hypothetical protein